MKKKQKLLVALMALTLAGGVGSALAIGYNQGTVSPNAASYDSAVYLYWDSASASCATLQGVTPRAGTPDYTYLVVTPKSTKSVEGYVYLDFTLVNDDTTNHFINNLTIQVYKTTVALTDSNVASGLTNAEVAELKCTIDTTSNLNTLTAATYFEISTNETSTSSASAHETTAYYTIKVSWNGNSVQGKVLGGYLSVAQSFSTTLRN